MIYGTIFSMDVVNFLKEYWVLVGSLSAGFWWMAMLQSDVKSMKAERVLLWQKLDALNLQMTAVLQSCARLEGVILGKDK